jgi:methionyl-tRNA formyltransferase
MAEKMDAGDIISQDKILIGESNTTKLTQKLSILGRDLLIKTLTNIISNNIKPIKQNESEVTFAYNISKEDEKINFNNTCKMVYNQIRGLSDVPGGYALYNDKKVKIYSSSYKEMDIDGEVGEIVDTNKQLGIKVKNGVIYPLTIQLEGKNKMSIKDFYNGMPNYFKKGEIIK